MEVRPGFKNTEVGVIPDQWAVKPLHAVLAKARLGGNYANGGVETAAPLIKMGNIARGRFDLAKVQFVSPGVAPAAEHRLSRGDVLFNTRNTLDLVGKVAIWRDELPVAYYNSNLLRLEFNPELLCSSEYANLFLNAERSVARLRALATGTTSVAAIYTRDLLGLPMVVPPSIEQRAIAEALSDVDALLAGLDRLIAKKLDIKQAAMQQLLTGQTRLPGFQGEWQRLPLSSVVADLEAGVSVNSVTGGGHHSLGEPGILKTSCVANGVFNPEEFKLIDQREISRARLSPSQNTLIISRMNTPNLVGEVGFVEQDHPNLFLPDRLWITRFRPDSGLWPKWLAYQMSSPITQAAIKDLASGTSGSMKNISKGKLLALPLDFPPPAEQAAIAALLSDMDAELTALEARRDKTRALKQGMMQELLTGRTRLV